MFYNLKLRLKVRSQFSSLYYSITICTVQANAFRAIVAGPFIIAEKDAEFGGGIFCFFISCGQRASRYLLTMCKADAKRFKASHGRSKAVWPDGCIIFQNWAIYSNWNWPKSIKIYQSWCEILHNTNLSFLKLPKDLQNIAKLAKFRQIWSHWDSKAIID